MRNPSSPLSANFATVARNICKLHRLDLAGLNDSPEADAVRDASDGPWAALSEPERECARWLSDDLLSISEPATDDLAPMTPDAQRLLAEAVEATTTHNLNEALALFRKLKRFLSVEFLSYYRGAIWLEMGDPETASVFLEYAARGSSSGKALALLLTAVNSFDSQAASHLAKETLGRPGTSPAATIVAAHILLGPLLRRPQDFKEVDGLKSVLEQSVTALAGLEGSEGRASRSLAFGRLAMINELRGEEQAALANYSRGLSDDPRNDGLLMARGILLYGRSPRAVSDFEEAVRLGTDLVAPYYFLAHHHLTEGRHEDCLMMCRRGLTLADSPRISSELEEWAAIARAELGFADDVVRQSFDRAIRRDPSNDRARRNLEIFESVRGKRAWETRPVLAVRESGQAEFQVSLAA